MKSFKELVSIALLVIVGSYLGETTSDPTLLDNLRDYSTRICSIYPDSNQEDEETRKANFTQILGGCNFRYNDTNLPQQMDDAESLEELTIVVKSYCKNFLLIKECNDNATSLAEVCLNESNFGIFKVVRNYFQLLLEIDCVGGEGESIIAAYWDMIVANNSTKRRVENECDADARLKLGVEDPFDGTNASVVSLQIYQYLGNFVDCVKIFSKTHGVALNATITHFTTMGEALKCVQNSDENVSCKDIPL